MLDASRWNADRTPRRAPSPFRGGGVAEVGGSDFPTGGDRYLPGGDVPMLGWGVIFGGFFGAGVGWAIYYCQPKVRARLQTGIPLKPGG